MKIAFIVPKLANQGPTIVVRDLIGQIKNKVQLIEVYYFDEGDEIEFPCNTYKISFHKKINFDNYDIIHSHMLRPDLYLWLNRNSIKKAKCISTLHQDIYENLKSSYNFIIAFIFETLWLKALKSQDVVVTLTDVMRHKYFRYLKNVFVSTIYNGRDISLEHGFDDDEKIENRKLIDIKETYKVIGVSALLTKRKGIGQIIKALPLLENYALVIVGDGTEKENLIETAESLRVLDRCFFLGYKLNAHRYLDFFDIYAMSSYSEGFPLALLEAAQHKLPTACSDIPIFRELFTDSEVSFFNLDDVISFKNAILNIQKDYAAYSKNVFEKVTEIYSAKAMGNNYLMLYKKMIDKI